MRAWRARMCALRSPALLSWQHELRCSADGEGVDAQLIDQRLGSGRQPEERPSDPAEYAATSRHETQALRYRAHHKLRQAFLEPEIFAGAVTLSPPQPATASRQLRLVDDDRD